MLLLLLLLGPRLLLCGGGAARPALPARRFPHHIELQLANILKRSANVPELGLFSAQQQSLLRQLEYYFSDESFSFDDFLQSEADASGAVPVATLAAFPRIVGMLPDHTDEQRQAESVQSAAG